MLIINIHLAYRLIMNGVIPLLPLYTFTAWTQATLPFTLPSEEKKVKFWIHHLRVRACLPHFKFPIIWQNTLYFFYQIFATGTSQTLYKQTYFNYQLNAQFLYFITICMLHYNPRHVSSINTPVFRRTNCIITASGIVILCKRLYSMPVQSSTCFEH